MSYRVTLSARNSRGRSVIAFLSKLAASVMTSLWAITAFAQAAPSEQPKEETVEEVVVTGSRIAAPNEVSTSPIQVLSSTYIQTSGKTDISDLITQLPQNFNNDFSGDLGNGSSGLTTAGGVSTADLRGLGPDRTLVLVDGRRLGQGSPYTYIFAPAPDLDQIPAGLIDRVEVVTGGASAAYGSDAIAGVVNFIMKKNFQGLQIDGQWNENLHDNDDTNIQNLAKAFGITPPTGTIKDGRQRNFDLLMGTNFADNQGNITAYLSYRHADGVPASDRDFGSCSLDPTTDAAGAVIGVHCAGSPNSNYFQPLTGPNVNPGTIYSVYQHNFIVQGTGVATTPPTLFDSEPYIYMTREDDRYNAAFLSHLNLQDYLVPYAEFYFMDDRTHQQAAPTALFADLNPLDPFGAGGYPTNCGNPLLSAQERGILCSPSQIAYAAANPDQACIYNTTAGGVTSPNCADVKIGRRNIEGGPRTSDYEHENYRAVIGTKGDFLTAWSYDAYGQFFYTNFFNSNNEYFNFQNIDNALQVNGTAAKPSCIVGAPCVPYNIWQDGGVTAQQLAYLNLIGTGQGTSTLRTLHAEVTGHLGTYGITSPLANEGVGVDLGWEHRNDHEYFQPDSAEQSGLLSGFGSSAVPLDESESVDEMFAELRVPLIQNRTGAKDLLFDTGYRRSDYSVSGTTSTYKFELQWAPIADYRLRASYDKAIRAPTLVELYNPQLVGSATVSHGDPCAPTFTNGVITAAALDSLTECEHMGVTAAQYGNGESTDHIPQCAANQCSQLSGGSATLKPEQAETFTVGINFAPSEIRGLSGSLDFYHIALNGIVGVVPIANILSTCAASGNPFYCSQIVRSPATGGLTGSTIAGGGYIVQTNVNAGAGLASGIDAQFNYKLPLPGSLGQLVFDMNGTYVEHFETTPIPGAHTYDCAGYFGFTCQTINPRWHHIFRTTWQLPGGVDLAATWRYIGPVSDDNNSPDVTLHFAALGNWDFFNARIPSYSYLDLAATYNVNKVLTLRGGINNVMDKDPPVVDYALVNSGVANTYSIYDMLGRQLFIAFTAKF
jgi:iron complex outermembrane recepter protein